MTEAKKIKKPMVRVTDTLKSLKPGQSVRLCVAGAKKECGLGAIWAARQRNSLKLSVKLTENSTVAVVTAL